MKKTLITIALVAVSAAAFAQGKVTFNNDDLHLFTLSSTLPGDSTGPIPVSPLPSGQTLQVTLYAGASANSLSLRTTIVLTAGNWGPTPGRMVSRIVTFADIGYSTLANVQVLFSTLGSTLPNIIDNGLTVPRPADAMYFGTSGAFTLLTGASAFVAPSLTASPSTWAAGAFQVTAVPEPSSMVLAGLGAASLLLFRRKK